jgi:hypothetical protein
MATARLLAVRTANRAVRPTVTAALDAAGVGWLDVVSCDDDLASDAMAAGDPGVRAEMECVINVERQAIVHAGQLPSLPSFSIVLYADDKASNHLNDTLVDYLARAFSQCFPAGFAELPATR